MREVAMRSSWKDNKGQTRPYKEGQPKKFVHAKEMGGRKQAGHGTRAGGQHGQMSATTKSRQGQR
jgi:hypothetical protein